MRSEFLRGGIEALHTPNPYDDEKGEPCSSLGYESDLSGAKIVQCLSEGNLSM